MHYCFLALLQIKTTNFSVFLLVGHGNSKEYTAKIVLFVFCINQLKCN